MAQIIKHRRGSLESVASATKRSGELLVVTGSAGITAANGDSLLFVGVDGSTVTPANKILQGTTVPDLTGASYDTSINGIPFYDTQTQKLYILNKGGNVEVQATANTNGTGIVSGSSQITISDTTGFTSFSSSLDSRLDSLEDFSSSLGDGFATDDELASVSSSFASTIAALDTDDIAEGSNLYYTDVRVKTKLNDEGVISGSSQVNADSITNFDENVKDKLNADTVISGSSQVLIDSVDGFSTFSSSVDSRVDALEEAVGAGSNIDGRLTALETFSGSAETDILDLEATASAHEANLAAIHTYTSSLKSAISVDGSKLTVLGNLEVQGTTTTIDSTTVNIGDNIIELNGTGAAFGGLMIGDVTAPNQVSGSLLWDATNDYWIAGPSGSESKVLLAEGDGVVSGSAQIDLASVQGDTDDVTEGSTNLYYTDTRVKTKLNAETVISGSSQVQIDSVTGFSSFSSSIDSRVDSLEAAVGEGSDLDTRLDALESFSSSLDDTFATEAELNAATASLSASIASTIDALDTDDIAEGSNLYYTDVRVKTKLDTETVVSSSAQVVASLLDQATDFGTGRVSGDDFGDVAGTSTFTGSFVGDGSQLTGLVTDLRISGSTGNDIVSLLSDDLTFAGGTAISVAVTDNTITINASDASTSDKGIASFDADDFSVASGNVSIKSGGVRAANLNADVAGTGISLNGVDNSIEVDYGSTSGTAVEGNTSLTVQGTTNEIEVTSGNVTLGAGGTVTIGLPDEVTIATASIQNDLSVGGNVEITGNLSVLGTTTTIDSTTIQLGDNIIELNGAGNANGGLLVKDVTAPNTVSGSLLWDSTNDYWKGGALGSEKEFARFNSTPTSGSVQVIGANGLLVDSTLTDDGTDATFSGDVIVDGFGSNANGAFLFADANNTLTVVAPSNAGDLIQWDGSSFVASNEIDGGTF